MKLDNEKILSWRKDIVSWINETVFFPTKTGSKKITLWSFQRRILRKATQTTKDGKPKYTTVCISLPKRNSKTFMASLILAWKFCNFFNVQGVVASNSREQASSILFDTFKSIIRHSPILLKIVGQKNILDHEVRIPEMESRVVCLSSNKATSFGYGIDIGSVDEIHAASDDRGLYDILASQTGDRSGLVLLPSQVSSKLNVFYQLYELSQTKRGKHIYFEHIQDKQLSPLVTKEWIESRKAELLPQVFDMFHRNRWVDSTSNMFPLDKVEAIFRPFESVSTYWEVEPSPRVRVGVGLDRALPFSSHGDRTVLTVLGWRNVEGQIHYWILRQEKIAFSSEQGIKKVIEEANREYEICNCVLETYQAADIFRWCGYNGIRAELCHAGSNVQTEAFTELYQVVDQGRLHSPYNEELDRELKHFQVDMTGTVPRFGHPGGMLFHDDYVYSLAWALFALRESVQDRYGAKVGEIDWS